MKIIVSVSVDVDVLNEMILQIYEFFLTYSIYVKKKNVFYSFESTS